MKKIDKQEFLFFLPYTPLIKQIVHYIFCGLITFGIDFSIYRFLLVIQVPITLSKGISFICSLFVSYYVNRTFVFRYKYNDWRFQRFLILATTNLIVNIFINKASLMVLGFKNVNICFVIATIVTVACSFIGQKFWVFKSYNISKNKSVLADIK